MYGMEAVTLQCFGILTTNLYMSLFLTLTTQHQVGYSSTYWSKRDKQFNHISSIFNIAFIMLLEDGILQKNIHISCNNEKRREKKKMNTFLFKTINKNKHLNPVSPFSPQL